jgi:hypothetical protein
MPFETTAHHEDRALHTKLAHDAWCDGVDERAAELGLRSLDEFMDAHPASYPLEKTRHWERWYSGIEADECAWFCRDCGSESLGDLGDGCVICGFGAWEDGEPDGF